MCDKGGGLLCCDGCTLAFHLPCIGQSATAKVFRVEDRHLELGVVARQAPPVDLVPREQLSANVVIREVIVKGGVPMVEEGGERRVARRGGHSGHDAAWRRHRPRQARGRECEAGADAQRGANAALCGRRREERSECTPRALARANEVCTRVASRVRLWIGALPLCALARDVVRPARARDDANFSLEFTKLFLFIILTEGARTRHRHLPVRKTGSSARRTALPQVTRVDIT